LNLCRLSPEILEDRIKSCCKALHQIDYGIRRERYYVACCSFDVDVIFYMRCWRLEKRVKSEE